MPEENIASVDVGVSSVRLPMGSADILASLGLLGELAGTWRGTGFNLIARPDFEDKSNLYLQLNQTNETLRFDPINAPIPNRGFGQDDITLFGLTYHQQISDAFTGGLLHVEPGLWITQEGTIYPPEQPPPGGLLVSRLGTIPHGNSLLAQGTAQPFTGPPTLAAPSAKYAFSQFPSFNSTPFRTDPTPALPGLRRIIHSEGTSEKLSTTAPVPFREYDLTIPEGINTTPENNTCARTPFKTFPPEPPLPTEINGVLMQDVVNDPIKLLQAVINQQVAEGKTFKGVALNVATQPEIEFFVNVNSKFENGDPTVVVQPIDGAGGIENILFLQGGNPVGANGANANATLFYATFWIEKVSGGIFPPFMQLQYIQMTILDFEVLRSLPAKHTNVGWPHISVATLRKSFI